MQVDLTALTKAVADQTTVEKSAVTLINGMAAQMETLIKNSGPNVDPVALQGLVDKMVASTSTLSAAVVANTVPPPVPVVPAIPVPPDPGAPPTVA